MAEITDIIHRLLERTNQDKVSWQSTVDEDTFVAVIGNLSVSLSISSRGYPIFQILNEEGREIESLSNSSEGYWEIHEELLELYNKAKRTALQVDSKLDELLTELTKDG